jgi:tRNA G46 methylase TrmB
MGCYYLVVGGMIEFFTDENDITKNCMDKPLQPTTQFYFGWYSHDTNHS